MKKIACLTAILTMATACGITACNTNKDITVYAPDGAPALAIAKLLKEDTETDGVSYHVVNPQTITSYVSYKDVSKNADICVLPFTTATQRLGKDGRYQTLGIVTHGNLYILSKNTTPITDISALSGETVGVLQLQSAPGQVLKSILHKNGVTDVTLTGISGGGDVGALNGVNYYVLAEPAVTAQKSKGFHIVGNIQTLYGGENGFPQAVLVAKTSLIENNLPLVKRFVKDVQNASAWLTTATGAEIVSAVSSHTLGGNVSCGGKKGYETTLKAPLLQAETLQRCGVWFSQSKDCKTEMQTFLQDVMQVDSNITITPNDGFYNLTDFTL